ncbi:hypothetical protein COX58_02705, partial [archaeon CG_4_10_14_0_2_um_filter_Archaea_38_6]
MNLLKFLFTFFLIAVFIILIFLFFSNSSNYNPDGFELNVSESILPDVSVYVLDSNKNVINSIDQNEFYFIQQRGLPEGTIYGFRVVGVHDEVILPVYETYTARTLDWVEANNYYLNIKPGNQTIEVLTINDSNGVIVARTNILVYNFESIVIDRCGNLTNEPVVDADGWSREGKIGRCVSNIAVEFRKVNVCDKLYGIFNDTGAGYGECLLNYAIITGDVSACEHAGMPKSRGFCKAKVAGDWTECRKITCDISCAMESLETQQDLCIQWYAIETRNASLCNEI